MGKTFCHMKKLILFLSFGLAIIVSCNKEVNSSESLSTINYRLLNTKMLISCLLDSARIEFSSDCFVAESKTQLLKKLPNEICKSKLPSLNFFPDSLLLGLRTANGGSGHPNELSVKYDNVSKKILYTIKVFQNDTSQLIHRLNWVVIPKIPYSSVVCDIKSVKR